jgi:flagellar biosynthesis chaperone FliJ
MGAKVANERYEYEKLYKYFGKTRRKLSELWKEKNAIRENERLKPGVKRVRMDEIYNRAVIIATRALDDYYRIVKKEGNGR